MNEYSAEERGTLLRLARQAIAAELRGEALDATPPSLHLAQPRGAFTTLHMDARLRGCIGYVLALLPLYSTIAETATAAAFRDPRFPPVGAEELPALRVEISVLSPMSPITPEEVEVGRHGLMLTHGNNRGLLLPQVPSEWGWERETFLAELCRKAGLPPGAWRQHGAKLECFTAEVFGENDSDENQRTAPPYPKPG